MIIFAGTYTRRTKSEGIYTLEFNEETEELKTLHTAMSNNPSFLAVSNGKLYAVNEMEVFAGYTRFLINQDYSLTKEQQLRTDGSSSCHIDADGTEGRVFVANYSSGDFLCYRITGQKEGDMLSMRVMHYGEGPNVRRQKKPHVHSTYITPDRKRLIVVDLGTDKLMIYDLHSEAMVSPNAINSEVYVGAGEGPRHLCFGPSGDRIYVITELLNHVVSFDYDEETGKAEKRSVFPAIPAGFKGKSTSAEIVLSHDGCFLYASNRGWDGLASFSVDKNGDIYPLGFYEGFGKTPRSFTISKDDRYFIIAYQDSGLVTVVKRNTATGAPEGVVASAQIPAVVCVLCG